MDKYISRNSSYSRGINCIIDIQKADAASSSEPVTLEEAKAHLSVDFTDDDEMITRIVKASRIAIENFTGVSIRPKRIEAILDNYQGEMELPYGPVSGSVEVLRDNEDGDEIEDAVVGVAYKKLSANLGRVYASYQTGFCTIPEDLRLAILNETAYRYENRGENNAPIKYETQAMSSGLSESARDLASPYKRVVCIL